MGSLRCKLFGHDYGSPTIDESRENDNGRTTIVETEQQVCSRCGHTNETSKRTRVVDNDDTAPDENEAQSTPEGEAEPEPDYSEPERTQTEESGGTATASATGSTTPSPSTESRTGRAGGTNPASEVRDSPETDTGVILESGSDTDESPTTDESESTTPSSGARDDIATRNPDELPEDELEDEGVVMLKETQAAPPQTVRKVTCDSCTFSRQEEETARRDGDLCPNCGDWLEVTVIEKPRTRE